MAKPFFAVAPKYIFIYNLCFTCETMIAFLSGKLLEKDANTVIVDVGGVGYEVTIPLSTFYELGEIGSDADPFAEGAVEKVRHPLNEGVHLDRLGLKRLASGKGQELAGQCGGARRRLDNRLGEPKPLVVPELRPPEHVGGSLNNCQ